MTPTLLRAALAHALRSSGRESFVTVVNERIAASDWQRHGDLKRWERAVNELPRQPDAPRQLDTAAPVLGRAASGPAGQAQIDAALRQLMPWRKGPLTLFGTSIDTEWASNLKWDRIRPALGNLAGLTVLDVGCGNGYFSLRAAGAGAAAVLGIDPAPLYVMQFAALARALGDEAVDVAPLALADLDETSGPFDQVWSMGVLYHRRSPLDHLARLRRQLAPGGTLLLETLVVPGGPTSVLVPPGRYARMRNVWFLPSVEALAVWLERSRFRDVRVVDISPTTSDEQRRTDWMPFESLAEALDPHDATKTREGHPAPLRAAVVANAR